MNAPFTGKTMTNGYRNSAILLVVVSALLWGIYWVPVYYLESIGISGAWAGFSINASALVWSLPAVVLFARQGTLTRRALIGALFCGGGISLYASAISFTDVVRTILFFYLSPVWSTAIECLFLGRRWSWRSIAAIAVTGTGLVAVLRGEIPLEGLGAVGDWMAIAAGLSWSIGTSLIFSQNRC